MSNPLYIIDGSIDLDQIQLRINFLEARGSAFVDSTVKTVEGKQVNLMEAAVVRLPDPVYLTQLVLSGSPKPAKATTLTKTCEMLVSGAKAQVDAYKGPLATDEFSAAPVAPVVLAPPVPVAVVTSVSPVVTAVVTPASPAAATAFPVDQILTAARRSKVAVYYWIDRGEAPLGYTKGMAVLYAQLYSRLKTGDPFAVEMAKAETDDSGRDVLAYYKTLFRNWGMENKTSGPVTLRHLFVLLMGLGMRESSGKYFEGRDRAASNTTSDTAEAGVFQTSWNAHRAHPLMSQLFIKYAGRTDLLDIFKEGVRVNSSDLENHGSGAGRDFQHLSKNCPAFAGEFAAIGLRNVCSHWGPINNYAAELRPEADQLFREVETIVDAAGLSTGGIATQP